MNKTFSLYLDLVRFTAACLVYLQHSNQRWLVAEVPPASSYGHSAVVVFFVLSGFVIAYVTDTKEREWHSYAASRLARVLSVAVPAVLLTPLLDAVGRQLLPAAYYYPFDRFVPRIFGSLAMLNEWWFVSITYFSNVPYWSIAYEVWYYVAFGMLVFLPGRTALAASLGVLVLIGPKVLLLAPIWGLGVLLYRWAAWRRLSLGGGWALWLASTIAIVIFHRVNLSAQLSELLKGWIGAAAHESMTWSRFFIGDNLLGLLVLCHFAGSRRVLQQVAQVPAFAATGIRWLASFTFTLYLMHQPLFIFWGAVLRGDPKRISSWLTVTLLTALSVLLLAQLTEGRRQWLRQIIHDRLRSIGASPASRHAEARR